MDTKKPLPAPDNSNKLAHLMAFEAMSFPLSRTSRFVLLPDFVVASAFGGINKLIQPIFNRSAYINYWIADIMGVAIGIVCDLIYRRVLAY